MTRLKSISLLLLLVVTLVAGWLWWVRPVKVDMAVYAPANSLLYLESNQPLAVADALISTDAWKIIDRASGTRSAAHPQSWLESVIRWTGIGPVKSVILARAQVAVVVTDLGTIEDGDTLKVKPEGVILIETHTTERRIRPTVEEALRQLAEITYGKPTTRRTTIEGVELIEWIAPEGSRQIVATIVGSLVIIGNTEQAVRSCLAVALRRNANLKEDPGLAQMRSQLAGDRALTFGYVPSANTARLLSVGVPLIMGRAPGDSEFQRLITTNAAKVLGDLGWSSHAFKGGIEDRYLISLQPSIVARLKPDFARHGVINQNRRLLPDHVHSVTYYRFGNPAAVWQDLKGTASSQMDVVSAVVFSSLLKSALLSYGIDDPETFLGAAKGEIVTLRLDQSGERTMLIGSVRDEESLRTMVRNRLGPNLRSTHVHENEIFEDAKGELGVMLSKNLIVLGFPLDVGRYAEESQPTGQMNDDQFSRITFFVPSSSSANIVTYSDDSHRIGKFISAVLAAKNVQPTGSGIIEPMIAELPYSATETTLGDRGFERVTKSPLGQFSALLPLLVPEKAGPTSNGTQAR
jgi:hypothetical protein